MAKFGGISWKIDNATKNRQESAGTLHESFLQYYRSKFPSKQIFEQSKIFQAEYKRLAKELSASQAIFENIPLASAFLDWVQEAHSKSIEEIEEAKFLLGNGFIGLKDSEGGVWTLHHASLHDPNEIYEAIRCRREWSLTQRERLVHAYMLFVSYLASRTDSYIKTKADLERDSIKDRDVSYNEFVRFADQLKDKIQLIAKLLYFGGDRTLDEVMKLTIPEVDFKENLIKFGSQVVPYPLHVFADIKAIIGKRSTGKVFLGRQNALLNPTTVFRNFKDVGLKTGLGSRFSPAGLTTNKTS